MTARFRTGLATVVFNNENVLCLPHTQETAAEQEFAQGPEMPPGPGTPRARQASVTAHMLIGMTD